MKTTFDGFLFNPLLYYGAGLVPAILVCTSLKTGLIYGLMLMFCLCLADFLVYVLKPLIKREIRIPCIILVVFSCIYIADALVYLFAKSYYNSLSSLIAMLVVSTVLLYKVDEGAYKSLSLRKSIWDGFINGLSYLFAVCLIGLIREFISYGNMWDINVGFSGISSGFDSMIGGLFITIIIAFLYNLITIPLRRRKRVFDSLVAKYSYYIQKSIADQINEERSRNAINKSDMKDQSLKEG